MSSLFPWQQYAADPIQARRIALRTEQACLTWQQLIKRIEQFAFSFAQQGVTEGHTVALCGKNSLELVLAYLAALQLGGRVLPINPAFTPEKIQQICQATQVYLLWREQKIDCFSTVQADKNFCHLTMTLTSGSSGNAKAVVHNISAHLANAEGVCDLVQFHSDSSWLLSLPLFHVSGQGILWRWLLAGAELYIAEKDFYLALTQVTHASLVPTQLQRWLAYLSEHSDLTKQTKHILLGGSHIPLPLVQQAEKLGFHCYCGYGMTEMASTVFAKRYDGQLGVGQPLAGREYVIIAQEIWLRGAGLGLGYWQQGKLIPLVNSQGWFATKDKGYWHNNELVITGRLDNMFISGGENIQPEDIEQVLLQYPKLKQAVVLPVEDKEFGQRPVAMIGFVQPYSREEVNQLQEWLADKLEKFKQPIAYFPLPQQTTMGIKIPRYQLQQQLAQLWNK